MSVGAGRSEAGKSGKKQSALNHYHLCSRFDILDGAQAMILPHRIAEAYYRALKSSGPMSCPSDCGHMTPRSANDKQGSSLPSGDFGERYSAKAVLLVQLRHDSTKEHFLRLLPQQNILVRF